MKPTVHLNGTAREELFEQYLSAGHALQDALAAMAKASPNGRDYYPSGPDALRVARNRWEVLMGHVRDAYQECQATAEHVADQ
jgi:hypothetical protein